ncbi:serine/threonine protein kinase-like protein [Phanerochaete sordida]|uniref:non-specific serine/threonine protein kinase n=1 Tax=Phanerochaete sordida TaxID=48140 RepID=A0A9P3LA64_9APHY|nr:serine/threonine protein kinase-like protein [Phanerochaete sordida]
MAEGYFKTFFQEECRLGMGANGSVFLCQHMLDGNSLGHFAVKKIAVGQSHSYLLNILREVRLLEKLHHPNIIQYHHAWLESCQFSPFGPKVPTLHMLMQWAEGGSLDDFIDVRLGRASPGRIAHLHPVSTPVPGASDGPAPSNPLSRSARIRAFRAMQKATPEERERLRQEMNEEVKSLFMDVVEGLAFLHEKSILHLDLKPGNVLLTWDEGRLIPKAMLSDFGTSQDMLNSRPRSGNTGTLEYASPESLPTTSGVLVQVDSKADMWSLGMILHKLLFFRLPYTHATDSPEKMDSRFDGREAMDLLEREVLDYPGFKSTPSMTSVFGSRRLPVAFLVLLENLLHINPILRPTSERVLSAIREGKLDPVPVGSKPRAPLQTSLVRAPRRGSFEERGRSRGPRDGTPTELPLWTESDSVQETSGDDAKEPFLGLPAPSEARNSPPEFEYMKLKVWNQEYRVTKRTAMVALKRTIKSLLLVWKVRSASAMYSDPYANHGIVTCALVLAFMDTWTERLTMSIILGAAHLALVRLAYWLH